MVSSAGNGMGENEEEEEEQEDTLLGLGGHNSEASDEESNIGEGFSFRATCVALLRLSGSCVRRAAMSVSRFCLYFSPQFLHAFPGGARV